MSVGGGRWTVERRIDPTELQIGHFVTELDIPWNETEFPLQGVLIDHLAKKKWLVDHCAWVVISDVSAPLPDKPSATRNTPANSPRSRTRSVTSRFRALSDGGKVTRETLDAALVVHDSLDEQVHALAGQFEAGGRLDLGAAMQVVEELSEVLEHHLAALVWLTRIKQRDDYTARHCINVSILAIGLAHALDWEREQVERAGLAGLLHDLGKTRVNPDILNKPGALTPAEFREVKLHTNFGYEMLRTDGDLPESVAEAVLCHHERPDGTGYPRGLRGSEIPALARLVSIVDTYDAITSERVYDAARSHHEALGILWKERNRQFDGPMVETFTQFLGWVTPGTLVRLTDSRLAMVMQAGEGRGLLPMVRLIRKTEYGYELSRTVDLAKSKPVMGDAPVRVAEVLPDGSRGIDVRELTDRF